MYVPFIRLLAIGVLIAPRTRIDYSKLPSDVTVNLCYLLDPLVATGGTAIAALQMLLDWGLPSKFSLCFSSGFPVTNDPVPLVQNVKLLAVLASESGLKRIVEEYPDLEVRPLSELPLARLLTYSSLRSGLER